MPSNVCVTLAKPGVKGRKPDRTSTGVEALLWQGRRNLVVKNCEIEWVLRRAVEGNHWVARSWMASSKTSEAHWVAVPAQVSHVLWAAHPVQVSGLEVGLW